MFDHLDPSLVAVPFYIVAMIWEGRTTARRMADGATLIGYEKRDTTASISTGLISVLTVGLLGIVLAALASWLWQWRLTDLGTGAAAWTVGMIAWDFQYYWLHRIEHEVRLFWATHVSHHSSEHYNFSTALRQPSTPLLVLVAFPPLALLGVRPWIIMTCGGFNLVYQFLLHTEVVDRLPAWFEALFNTPSHHRVHHGSNPQYIDKNHGGMLIVWDRLFGTFAREEERVVYGLTKNIRSFNLWTIFIHEFSAIAQDVRRARTVGEALGYLFRAPGWRPTGALDGRRTESQARSAR
jgi:sterol desaturase/sphingolipid hydroxylase (fatty acid hydroxylase superfamily)